MNQNIASNIVIDEDSLSASPTKQKTGGLLQFPVHGKFIHFNTIEEYQALEFPQIMANLDKFGMESANFDENYIVLVCFGDLKNYDFHYKCAMVQGLEKFQTLKGKKLSKSLEKPVVECLSQSVF